MGLIPTNEKSTATTITSEIVTATCDCRRTTESLCRQLRPVLEDAGNYIRFITDKIDADPSRQFYREARTVVLANISEALTRIDELMSDRPTRISLHP